MSLFHPSAVGVCAEVMLMNIMMNRPLCGDVIAGGSDEGERRAERPHPPIEGSETAQGK